MPRSSIAFMEQHRGKLLSEASPELYHRGMEQVNAARQILENRGIIVHQAEPLKAHKEAYLDGLLDGYVQHFVLALPELPT